MSIPALQVKGHYPLVPRHSFQLLRNLDFPNTIYQRSILEVRFAEARVFIFPTCLPKHNRKLYPTIQPNFILHFGQCASASTPPPAQV